MMHNYIVKEIKIDGTEYKLYTILMNFINRLLLGHSGMRT